MTLAGFISSCSHYEFPIQHLCAGVCVGGLDQRIDDAPGGGPGALAEGWLTIRDIAKSMKRPFLWLEDWP